MNDLVAVVDRLETPRRFPSACSVQPYLERSEETLAAPPGVIPEGALSPDQLRTLKKVRGFAEKAQSKRSRAIEVFIASELDATRESLDTIETDTIETNPLTVEQRLAILTDEDATF